MDLISSLKKISEIVNKDVDILDRTGNIIYSSDISRLGNKIIDLNASVMLEGRIKYYLYIGGGSSKEISLARLILQDKLFDGTAENYQQFLINIIEGINQPRDSFDKFNIPYKGEYIVYCIHIPSQEHFNDALSLISNSFYEDSNVWVFPYDDEIVMIQRTDGIEDKPGSNACMIRDMINSELYTHAFIGIGNTCRDIQKVSESFSQAREAIGLGKLFNIPGGIFTFKDILSERIVSLIPEDKAEEITIEIFNDDPELLIDEEMIKTFDTFFKNNLNISDTSRALYIHRNTLIYRLNKIQKLTGLDIRMFQDAVTFRLGYLLNIRRKL